ncbi:MAG: LD-carboxypeptidase [Cyanobium sp. NAT70]|nr:LD-carboxypeptidase [Cyanobium sp. NAT70]|tara:strand:+ start:6795 stop:7769 length:975 start_codon:yes stop_codon:yes gene_type:complete
MPSRRSLLISGAAAALALMPGRRGHSSAQRQLAHLKPLHRGARLRAVNPGTWMDPETDFTPLIERCAAEGWHLEIPESVRHQWRYFSGRDQDRLADLKAAWADPNINGVLYVGGGWGGARVLEAGFRFPKRPLWSLGFSDSSSLLLAQWSAGLIGAIHGSMGGPKEQWDRTVNLLRGKDVEPLRGVGMRKGIATGPLVVTNLTVATHLIGTPWFPDLRGSILVLEDVGEAPYRVDRMLTQWRSAGRLQGLAGVATGRFSWKKDDILPGDFTMEEVLEQRLGDLGIPLVMDLPVGHGLPNLSLPLGRQAMLNGRTGHLTVMNKLF